MLVWYSDYSEFVLIFVCLDGSGESNIYVHLVWGCNYMGVCFLYGCFHWIGFDTEFMSFILYISIIFVCLSLVLICCWIGLLVFY